LFPATPRLATNYRESGLVHRPYLYIGRCEAEGWFCTQLTRSEPVLPTAGLGHQERFPPPRLSGGCGFQSGPLLPTIRAGNLLGRLSATCSAMCRETRRGRLPPSLPDLTAAPSAD